MSAPDAATLSIEYNQTLFDAVVGSVPKALAMCGCKAKCCGVSTVPPRQEGEVTGLIGAHGRVSGFVAVNMTSRLAVHAVSGLLGETHTELSPQVVDGAGEVTNIIVGGIKSTLSHTDWAFSNITVPSVVVGDGYQVAFSSGLELLDVCFQVDNPEAIRSSDRMLHVGLSFLKL